jgi:GNAT superfamily N-acetyltransferase
MVVQRMGGNRSMARATSPMRGCLRLRREQPLPAGITVRHLQRSDTLALGHLMVVAYSGTFDDRGQTRSLHESEAARTIAGEYGAVQWDASLVAEAPEGEVIGATVVTHDRGHLLLAFALVAPAWRNQGLGTALIVIQRQLGHSNLGITSVYLQGIDSGEIFETVQARRAPMIPVNASLRL